jgi:ABC-2 type transport system permease protein
MWKELKFALYTMRMNLRNAAELRTSFGLQVVGMALSDIAIVFLWFTFLKQVGGIGGWTAPDAVGSMGFSAFSFGMAMTFFFGIMKIPQWVATGGLDRFLLSPKNILLRVTTAEFGLSAVGDILFGALSLIIYAFWVHMSTEASLMLVCAAFCSILATFGALLLTQSVAFYFFDSQTLAQGLWESFLTPSLYAGGAFQGAMRLFFTFIIPALLVGTLPLEAVKHLSWWHLLSIFILSVFFFALSIVVFYRGLRRYESASLGGFSG